MAAWARRVTRDPNGTSAEDVQELRDAGFSDADIFAMTVYVALRVALSTVNDALGARPDAEYRMLAPAPARCRHIRPFHRPSPQSAPGAAQAGQAPKRRARRREPADARRGGRC